MDHLSQLLRLLRLQSRQLSVVRTWTRRFTNLLTSTSLVFSNIRKSTIRNTIEATLTLLCRASTKSILRLRIWLKEEWTKRSMILPMNKFLVSTLKRDRINHLSVMVI